MGSAPSSSRDAESAATERQFTNNQPSESQGAIEYRALPEKEHSAVDQQLKDGLPLDANYRAKFERMDMWLAQNGFVIACKRKEDEDEAHEKEQKKKLLQSTFVCPQGEVTRLRESKQKLISIANRVPDLQEEVRQLHSKAWAGISTTTTPLGSVSPSAVEEYDRPTRVQSARGGRDPAPPGTPPGVQNLQAAQDKLHYSSEMMRLAIQAKDLAEKMLLTTQMSLHKSEQERAKLQAENQELQDVAARAQAEAERLAGEHEAAQSLLQDLRASTPAQPLPSPQKSAPHLTPLALAAISSQVSLEAEASEGRLASPTGTGMHGEILLRQTVQRNCEAFGEHHVTTLSATLDLADFVGKVGNVAEAEQLYNSTLDIVTEKLNQQDQQEAESEEGAMYASLTMTCITQLAALMQAQGKLVEAERFYREALAGLRDLGNHAAVADCAFNLGSVYEKLGEYANAMTNYDLAADQFLATYGSSHTGTRKAYAGAERARAEALKASQSEPTFKFQRETQEEKFKKWTARETDIPNDSPLPAMRTGDNGNGAMLNAWESEANSPTETKEANGVSDARPVTAS